LTDEATCAAISRHEPNHQSSTSAMNLPESAGSADLKSNAQSLKLAAGVRCKS
jgi:hypothetical protein